MSKITQNVKSYIAKQQVKSCFPRLRFICAFFETFALSLALHSMLRFSFSDSVIPSAAMAPEQPFIINALASVCMSTSCQSFCTDAHDDVLCAT